MDALNRAHLFQSIPRHPRRSFGSSSMATPPSMACPRNSLEAGGHSLNGFPPCSATGPSSKDLFFQSPRRPRGTSMSDAIFRPRPYEEIYAEQAYLTSSLQVQSSNANELLRQYSWLEEALHNMKASRERRYLRKQLSLVRSQLSSAAQQEKAIFVRLIEVYMELQSRDAWAQTSRQRAPYRGVLGQPWNHVAARRPPPPRGTARPSGHLNGASPEFVPTKNRAVQRPTDAQVVSGVGLARPPASPLTVQAMKPADADGSGQGRAEENSDDCARYPRMASAGRSRTWDGPSLACRTGRDNRLSLPNLESIWPK